MPNLSNPLNNKRTFPQLWTAAAAGFLAVLLTVHPAFAHSRVEVGPYTIVIGWQKEPVIVGDRNAILLEITEDETGVEGLEGSLELTVFYGGETFIGQLAPTGIAGVYIAEILPTVRGQYEVQLVGQIGDEPVDVILEPEEVLPAAVLQFPEPLPDPAELTLEVDGLVESIERLQTLAAIGVIAGGAGLLLGVAGLVLALRKSTPAGR